MPLTVLERIAAGDPSAVDECIERFGRLVWSLVRRYCRDYGAAEDAVQEIFIDVWKNAARFDPQAAAETTFIAMLARRRLIDRYRKSQRRPAAHSMGERDDPPASHGGDLLETAEEAQRAREALEQLRPREREVIRLAIDQGFSQSQIAEVTGLPLGTVKTHARRGLMRLRQLLAPAVAPFGKEDAP